MTHAEVAGSRQRGRKRRTASEKLEIVQLTMKPGASVAEIARAHDVNANRVFKWRRLFERGQLADASTRPTALLPVTISADVEASPGLGDEAVDAQAPSSGAIHIELHMPEHEESELGVYPLVLLAHVVEHLPDPLKLITKLRSYVADGGCLYIETPQEVSDQQRKDWVQGTSSLQIGIHEHINFYFPQSVSALLEAAGFEVAALECTRVDLGWAKSNHIRALGRNDLPLSPYR
ncbi:methyltransferase domain-containing protein [Acidobacteria bacterium AB60]|nr:methyltransferase domain-containing protein [Acidobacteria bacterium AB60]